MIAALVVMMQLGGQLKGEVEDQEMAIRPLLGVSLEDFHPQSAEQESNILVSFLIFTTFYACSSCMLVYASIVRNQLMAVPWMICESASFWFHIVAATINTEDEDFLNTRLVCSLALNFVLTAYFWSVVCLAVLSWSPKEMVEEINLTPKRSGNKIKLQDKSSPPQFGSPV